jgi:oxygen-independent coproporphyrinogen-3 oxidase
MELPPLSLYVHLPWCVRKCPYCDFNSHGVKGDIPGDEYVQALLEDLEQELPLVWGRTVHSIFFGGGTPSLFSARQIGLLISGFRSLLHVSPAAEVTLEANPGTTEHDSFAAYHDVGVNRISLGVQSFSDDHLSGIGRIHGRAEVERAVAAIHSSGIRNFNIDLMFALPGQSTAEALEDVRQAVASGPSHISHYQLTIEPNTAFHASPPVLPDEDSAWVMQQECGQALALAGYVQYEISAWAHPGFQCRHNLNYWRYGDFLGIGAGAHGKITMLSEQAVRRRIRLRHPGSWLKAVSEGAGVVEDRALDTAERVFEFFLNQLRLRDGVIKAQLEPRAGVSWSAVEKQVKEAVEKGLLRDENDRLTPTELGWRFVNEIQAIFLP